MVARFTTIIVSVNLFLLLQERCWGLRSEYGKAEGMKNWERANAEKDEARGMRSLAAPQLRAPTPTEVLEQLLANVGSHTQQIGASMRTPANVLSLLSSSEWKQMREKMGITNTLSGQKVIRVVRNADGGMMGQVGAAGGDAFRNAGQQMSDAINKASDMVNEHSAMAGTVLGMAGPMAQDKINAAADEVGKYNPMAGHAMKIGAEAVPHAVNAAADAVSQGGEVASKMMNMAATAMGHGANAAADVFNKATQVFGQMIPFGGGGGGGSQVMGQAANAPTQVGTGMFGAATSMVGSMFG